MLELINELSSLSDNIFALMKKTSLNADFGVEAQDSRLVALSGMQDAVLACGFWINTYHSITDKNQDESMILIYSESNIPLDKTTRIMLDQVRLGLVVSFHFKLENLISGLINHNKETSKKNVRNIDKMFKELVNEVELDGKEDKLKILKAFSSIRNSLHNNGIHIHGPVNVDVGDLKYNFEKNEVVQCASLNHIIKLISYIVEIMGEIIDTDKIKEIKNIIPEKYSEWLEEQ